MNYSFLHLLTNNQSWDELRLPTTVVQQLEGIILWLQHKELHSSWPMKKSLKPGYKVLFHGPPGTGKTMTAAMIGKKAGKQVYKVDLSAVVSKYIGETEKNLHSVFNAASQHDWVLFFDEADAIFGKRTEVRDAHDRYANLEVSYLLQQMENHEGLLILASNMKNNIDEAFFRRFQCVVEFPHK